MRLPVSLGWKAGLLLLALAIQLFAHQASSSVNAQAIPDVGVTGIQVPTDPVTQGDIAEIAVTVQNLGSATASVTVTLLDTTDSSQITEKTEDIDADATEVVTLAWDTTEASLGNHTLRAVAVVEGDTNVDNDSLLSTDAVTIVAPTTTDVGVTGIQVPTDPVTQGDIAEIAVTVQNLGSATASVTVTLLDTTDSSQITEKTKDIDADATEVVTLAWDTTEASLGNHTLRAVAVVEGDTNGDNDSLLSTDAVTIVAPTTTDVGVTGIQVPTDPVSQGDVVEIDVTVQNLGSATASVTVTLLDTTDPGQVAEKTKDIDADATEVVTLAWDTTEASLGNHTLRAVAVVEGDTNVDNDSLLSTDAVTIVAPTTTDVGVTGIQVPTDPVSQGDVVEIDVTVQNLGSATASVTVTLLDTTDSSQITEKTEDIDADATEVVTLAWDTTEASLGNHTLRAVAVVEGDANADNDSLLSTDAVIIVAPEPPYAVAVTAVEVPAGPVIQGDTVDVDVTVENQGTSDANAEITLLYIPDQGQPGIAAEETVLITAGTTKTVTLSWDTADATPGVYTIRAGVTLVEDGNAADSMDAASTITIGPPTYGVSITAFDVPSGPATQGDVVDADVTVENLGSVAAMFKVTLFDQPTDGPEQAAVHETVEIAAAATKTVTLSWDTSDAAPGPHTFRAGVALVEDANVSDSRDSAATITISPPPYAVAVTAVEVPGATAIQGATVDVDATVENQGTSDANAEITLLYVPAQGQSGIAAQKTVAIAAGATETVTLSWDTSDAPFGIYTIRAGVTLAEDSNAADSLDAASTITIVAPATYAVAVTAVDVSAGPVTQGDTVSVDVTVENQGTSDANAAVTLLYIPDQGEPGTAAEKTVAIAAGASETVTLSWDTSGVTPGVYTIRAGATLVEDSNAADFRDAASTIIISTLTYGVSITAFDVPSGPATQGYVVDAYVTVENLSSVAAMFTVTLFDQPAGEPERAADHETVEIAAATTKTVTLSWDTSDAAPGPHTFRAGVALVEDANVSDSRDSAAIITISPPPYAVAIAAVQVASATVIQGATVNVDVTVENQGTFDANATVTLVYTPAEGEQGIAAEKTVPIAAGESVTITLSWDTSNAAPGVYTVRAGATLVEDTDVAHFLVSTTSITISAPPPYAVAVTAVNVASATATQGNTVEVDVTVENQGTFDANAEITLLYVPAEGEPGTAAEKTVAIAAGASETVTLSWDTFGVTPGVYTIRAGATLVEDSNAADSRDAASTIIISALTYGVSITAFDVPSGPATQGYVVDAYVTVENLGSVAAMFTVTLFDQPAGGPEGTADEETVEIAAAATKTVTLSWDTSDAAPGPHTFRAGVALVEDANVSDSRDSAATITISIPPSYAVAVTAVVVPDGPVTQGNTVEVDVTVENQGTSDANAKVTLLYVLAEGEPGIAAEKTVAIAAGDSETVTLSWDTSNATPGAYTIRAGATLVEDTDVADSLVSTTSITISAPPTYAVAFTAVDVSAGPVIQGDTVNVDVTVENQGTSNATAVVTLLYIPAAGQPGIAAAETVAIAAGESGILTLSWDTSEATLGAHIVRAGATLVEDSNAADSRDAASTITISPPTYGVAVTAIDVPAVGVAMGAAVDVDVTIENLGNTEVNAKVTLLYQPDRGQGGTADEKTVEIVPGASVTITLSWDTSGVTPGVHTMRAGVTLVEDSDARDFLDSASTITVVSGRIILGGDRGLHFPDASFGGTLAAAPVETTPSLVTRFLIFGGFAKGYKTSSPVIETSLVPHDKLFTTNAQATFGSGLQNPFELGEIRVTVHLEERPNSLGAYVMVGSQTFFADANGNCRIVVPSGFYDLAIQAPGYVSARIPGVRLGIGEAVTVPELTLPFGDSNGDGLIDILDLSVAAGNFGATIHEISLP